MKNKKQMAFNLVLVFFTITMWAWAVTKIRQVQIVNSTVDSTPIGSASASTGNFTSVTLPSGQPLTSTTGGTSGIAQTTRSFSGASNGTTICYDSLGEIVFGNSSCGFTQVSAGRGTGCTTGSGSYNTCPVSITWSQPFADTNYDFSCTGIGPSGAPAIEGATSQSTSGVSINITNGTNNGATVSGYSTVECVAVHP